MEPRFVKRISLHKNSEYTLHWARRKPAAYWKRISLHGWVGMPTWVGATWKRISLHGWAHSDNESRHLHGGCKLCREALDMCTQTRFGTVQEITPEPCKKTWKKGHAYLRMVWEYSQTAFQNQKPFSNIWEYNHYILKYLRIVYSILKHFENISFYSQICWE